MATEKKTVTVEEEMIPEAVLDNDERITHEQPERLLVRESTNNRQTVLTIAIASSVVLFFIGLGLGYLFGRSTGYNRFDDRYQMPMMNGFDRSRSSINTQNNTQSTPDTVTNQQATPNTQNN